MLTFCREATENTPAALHEFPNSVVVSRAALALDAPYWLAVLEVDAAVHAPGGQRRPVFAPDNRSWITRRASWHVAD
jgi:hypothetical protein